MCNFRGCITSAGYADAGFSNCLCLLRRSFPSYSTYSIILRSLKIWYDVRSTYVMLGIKVSRKVQIKIQDRRFIYERDSPIAHPAAKVVPAMGNWPDAKVIRAMQLEPKWITCRSAARAMSKPVKSAGMVPCPWLSANKMLYSASLRLMDMLFGCNMETWDRKSVV